MRRLWWAVLLAACAREKAPAPPAALATVAARGPHSLAVTLTPKAPRLSDRLSLTIKLRGPKDIEEEPDFDLEAFDVVESRALPVKVVDSEWTHEWAFLLDPRDAGPHTLGPFAVGSLESEPLAFEVTSTAPPEPRLADLRGPAPAVAIPPERASAWWWLLAVPALALAAWLLFRRKTAPPARVYTPSELAQRELATLLRDDPLARGEFSAFYSELTLIVRRYIERTTGIRAPEQTTPEFLRECRDMPRLGAFLEAADLVKFAAVRPGPAEIDDSVDRAKEFVGLA